MPVQRLQVPTKPLSAPLSLRSVTGCLSYQLFTNAIAIMIPHQEEMACIVLIIKVSLHTKDLF